MVELNGTVERGVGFNGVRIVGLENQIVET